MKRLVLVFPMVLIILVVLNAPFAFAELSDQQSNVINCVYVDGSALNFDVTPIVEEGRTLVPVRTMFESLGATVNYDNVTNTVYAKTYEKNVIIPIGKKEVIINDKVTKIDVSAKIINGRTLVPARAVGEAMGAVVKWDSKTNSVYIYSSKLIQDIFTVNLPEAEMNTIIQAALDQYKQKYPDEFEKVSSQGFSLKIQLYMFLMYEKEGNISIDTIINAYKQNGEQGLLQLFKKKEAPGSITQEQMDKYGLTPADVDGLNEKDLEVCILISNNTNKPLIEVVRMIRDSKKKPFYPGRPGDHWVNGPS